MFEEEEEDNFQMLASECLWVSTIEKRLQNITNKNPPPEQEPEPEVRIDRLAELRERVRAAGGDDLELALEKPLTTTDVSRNHGRLSLPNRYLSSKFLTEQETSQTKRREGLWVQVVDERSREFHLRLREWSMSKDVLNLNGDWNSVVSQNSLAAEEVIQLWSFRRGSSLCFALVKAQT